MKANAKNFEDSAFASLEILGVEVEEISKWNCCGTVYSLTTDDIIHHMAPVRNLIRVKEADNDRVMTLCAMCYNTLKRSNERVKNSPEDLKTINEVMYRENIKYNGDVEVFHLLEMQRDVIKFENIAKKVVKPLANLKIANYYGCMLVRPKGIGIDDLENPTIMENLMESLGTKPVNYPYKTECCGSYQTVDRPDLVAERAYQIISSAKKNGAEVLSVSCPLCAFNLDHRQKETMKAFPEFQPMPVMYFTQLTAIALGCDEKALGLELHYVDPKPLLKEKGLL
jgi:heterodisulfide reductase subunit B